MEGWGIYIPPLPTFWKCSHWHSLFQTVIFFLKGPLSPPPPFPTLFHTNFPYCLRAINGIYVQYSSKGPQPSQKHSSVWQSGWRKGSWSQIVLNSYSQWGLSIKRDGRKCPGPPYYQDFCLCPSPAVFRKSWPIKLLCTMTIVVQYDKYLLS